MFALFDRNPSLLLSLMAVKSETNLVPKSSGGDWQFSTGGGDEYQCFSSGQGECETRMEDVNGNVALGPYQDKIENLAMTLSILATRMGTRETQADGKPLFVSHFYHENSGELDTLQGEWNSHLGKATLLTGLELHWMHTAVVTLDRLGMRNTNWERRSRYGKDYLEWATALHVHEFGITSKKLGDPLSECTATQDPLKNCGLDSGGLLAGVRETCKMLDCSQTVYDYPVTSEQLNKFLDVIQWSYPYSVTEGQSSQRLEWPLIRNATTTAFNILAKNRAKRDSSFVFFQSSLSHDPCCVFSTHHLPTSFHRYDGKTISLRYDWRACVAVLRAYLPPHETCAGPTFHGVDHEFYGIFSDESYGDKDEWPLDECFTAGGNIDQCSVQRLYSGATSQLVPSMTKLLLTLFVARAFFSGLLERHQDQ